MWGVPRSKAEVESSHRPFGVTESQNLKLEETTRASGLIFRVAQASSAPRHPPTDPNGEIRPELCSPQETRAQEGRRDRGAPVPVSVRERLK